MKPKKPSLYQAYTNNITVVCGGHLTVL